MFVWGSPQFADLRPAALDDPLVGFHLEVRGIVRDAVAAVQNVDTVRDLHFMNSYFEAVSGGINK